MDSGGRAAARKEFFREDAASSPRGLFTAELGCSGIAV